jgi:cob(I)alamin adenosyltransferase
MSRQDDQLQEKLQHIETELSAEAEKLSRVLAKIQKNWDDPGAALVTERLNRQVRMMEDQVSALRMRAESFAGNQEEL